MRLLGLSRICFTVLSVSLAVLLASCLPPSANRNRNINATSIDPALAFDNPVGGTTTFGNQARGNGQAWGDPKFPNQPIDDFQFPLQPPDVTDSASGNDPSDELMPDLDLDLTLGSREPELEPPEPDLSLDGFGDDEAGPAEKERSEAAGTDRAPANDPVERNNFSDLYPDVQLPDEVARAVADP